MLQLKETKCILQIWSMLRVGLLIFSFKRIVSKKRGLKQNSTKLFSLLLFVTKHYTFYSTRQTSGNSQAIDWVPSSIDLLWFDKFFHIFCFLTNFSEIFSISIFFRGRLNGTVKSDTTLPHSAHFALHSAHFALFFKVFCFSR